MSARTWRAIAVAGVLSGVPSTVHAAVTGRPMLAPARAAGTMLGRPTVARGAIAHTAITTFWTLVLARLPLGRRPAAAGAAAGLAIAAVDLSIARRWFPAIAALAMWPQVADHVAFGALAAVELARPAPTGA